MMPWPRPNAATAPKLEEFYRSGKFWMQLSLPMPRRKPTQNQGEAISLPFVTIDDAIQTAETLVSRLRTLGEYKHPLGVRKGVSTMAQEETSRVVKAGGKTYFFDLKKTKEGKAYLTITESRFKKDAGTRERAALIVFPEHLQEFISAIQDMAIGLEAA